MKLKTPGRRSTEEWIGDDADTKVPDRVILRLRERARDERGRIVCQGICHRVIGESETTQADHLIALVNWVRTPEAPHGNRESNLRLLCDWCHKKKTEIDVAMKSKAAHMTLKRIGRKQSRNPVAGSKRSPFKRAYDRETGRWRTQCRKTGEWL